MEKTLRVLKNLSKLSGVINYQQNQKKIASHSKHSLFKQDGVAQSNPTMSSNMARSNSRPYSIESATAVIATRVAANVMSKAVNKTFFEQDRKQDHSSFNAMVDYNRKNIEELAMIEPKAVNNHWDYLKRTPIYYAIKYGDYTLTSNLIMRGAKVNISDINGITPLQEVAFSGNIPIFELILNECINQRLKEKYTTEKKVFRGIYHSVKKILLGDKITPEIIKHNQITRLTNNRWNVLMLAVANGHLALVKLIANLQDNINIQNADGDTALILAIKNRDVEMVKFLLSINADITLQNNSRETALHIASREGMEEIVKVLFQYGAKSSLKLLAGEYQRTSLHEVISNMGSYGKHLETAKFIIENNSELVWENTSLGRNIFDYIAAISGYLNIYPENNAKKNNTSLNTCIHTHLINQAWKKKYSEKFINLLHSIKTKIKIDHSQLISSSQKYIVEFLFASSIESITELRQKLTQDIENFKLKNKYNNLDTDDNNILHLAILLNDQTYLKNLIESLLEIEKEQPNRIYSLLTEPNKYGTIPLYDACFYGLDKSVISLLQYNPIPQLTYKRQRDGWTPLLISVWSDHLIVLNVIKEFCDKSNPYLFNELLNYIASEGISSGECALFFIITNGLNSIFNNYQNHFDNFNIYVRGQSLLHWAVVYSFHKPYELIKKIIHKNPRLLEKKSGIYNFTPLLEAAYQDDFPMVRLLVESGADVFAKSKEGRKAIDLTSKSEIKQYLLDKMNQIISQSQNVFKLFDQDYQFNAKNKVDAIAEEFDKLHQQNLKYLLTLFFRKSITRGFLHRNYVDLSEQCEKYKFELKKLKIDTSACLDQLEAIKKGGVLSKPVSDVLDKTLTKIKLHQLQLSCNTALNKSLIYYFKHDFFQANKMASLAVERAIKYCKYIESRDLYREISLRRLAKFISAIFNIKGMFLRNYASTLIYSENQQQTNESFPNSRKKILIKSWKAYQTSLEILKSIQNQFNYVELHNQGWLEVEDLGWLEHEHNKQGISGLEKLKESYKLNPADPDTINGYAFALSKSRNEIETNKAIALFEKAIKTGKNNYIAKRYYARFLIGTTKEENFAKAEKLILSAITEAPEYYIYNFYNYYYLAYIKYVRDMHDEAKENLYKAFAYACNFPEKEALINKAINLINAREPISLDIEIDSQSKISFSDLAEQNITHSFADNDEHRYHEIMNVFNKFKKEKHKFYDGESFSFKEKQQAETEISKNSFIEEPRRYNALRK